LLDKLKQSHFQNIDFADFVALVEALGFALKRTSGSHQLFSREGLPEILNLQPLQGQAKPYQARQLLRLIERYNLKLSE
jgi:hypothetical protein